MPAKQFKSLKEVIEHIKSMPPQPVVNEKLKKHLRLVINDLITRRFRKSAMEILLMSDQDIIGEFLYYYYSDSGNVACMVIDKAKRILVKKRKIKARQNNWGDA